MGDATVTGLTLGEDGNWTVKAVTSGGEEISYDNVKITGLAPSGDNWTVNSILGSDAAIALGSATITNIDYKNGVWTIETVSGSVTLGIGTLTGITSGENGYSLDSDVNALLALIATITDDENVANWRAEEESNPLNLTYTLSPQSGAEGLNGTVISEGRTTATTISRNWNNSDKSKKDKKSFKKEIKENEDAIVDYVQVISMAVEAGESLSDLDYNNI